MGKRYEIIRTHRSKKFEEAARQGEFEHLPNASAKIDYQEYLAIPIAQRMMYKLMRDARVVPCEISLKNAEKDLRMAAAARYGIAVVDGCRRQKTGD